MSAGRAATAAPLAWAAAPQPSSVTSVCMPPKVTATAAPVWAAISSPSPPVYRAAASPEPPRPRTLANFPVSSPPPTNRKSSDAAGSSTPAPAWDPPDDLTPRRMGSEPALAPGPGATQTPKKASSAKPLISPRNHVQATPPLVSPRTQSLSSPRMHPQVFLAPTPAGQHRALSPPRSATITRVHSPPPPPVAMAGPGPASVTQCSGWASPRLLSPAPSPPVPITGVAFVPLSARERRLVPTEATFTPLVPSAAEVPAWVTPRVFGTGSLRVPPRTAVTVNAPAAAASLPLGSPRVNSPRASREEPQLTRSVRVMPSPVRLIDGDWYISNADDRPLSKRWAAASSQAGGNSEAAGGANEVNHP